MFFECGAVDSFSFCRAAPQFNVGTYHICFCCVRVGSFARGLSGFEGEEMDAWQVQDMLSHGRGWIHVHHVHA